MNWGEKGMISKTSLFNKGLILSDIKRFWWVSALYAVLLFFVLPFNHLLQSTTTGPALRRTSIIWSLKLEATAEGNTQMLLLCSVPVLLAVLLFRYMHSGKATAAIHSLPCSRKTLYVSHSVSGLLLLTLPVLLTGLLLAATYALGNFETHYSLALIPQWVGFTLLFNYLFFSIALFAGMLAGSSIAHLVLTYLLHLLPIGISMLLDYNLYHLLYGYSLSPSYDTPTDSLPMVLLFKRNVSSWNPPVGYQIVYLLLTLFFFIAAGRIYKLRKLEAAGEIIAFPVLRPLFKYGITLCGMLLCGAYSAMISEGSIPMILIGYLLGSLIGYFLTEILIRRSMKVWHLYKGYLAFCAVIAVLLMGVATDVTDFVKYVPKPEDVQEVYYGFHQQDWYVKKFTDADYNLQHRRPEEYSYFFESTDAIKSVTNLHSQLIQKPYNKKGLRHYVIYTLKNGKHIIRQYPIDDQQYAASLKPIYESVEFKRVRYPFISYKTEEIEWMEIGNPNFFPTELVLRLSPSDSYELLELLKEEIFRITYEEMLRTPTGNHIQIQVGGIRNSSYILYSLPFQDRHEALNQWLKAKGYYEKVTQMTQRISYTGADPLTLGVQIKLK